MSPKPNTDTVRGHAVVPENVLRRRKNTEQMKAERNEKLALERARKPKKVAGTMFKKAAAFVQEFRRAKASEIRGNVKGAATAAPH